MNEVVPGHDMIPATRTSQKFCDPTADIVFQSSDNVLFRLHSRHLLATSAVLCVPDHTVVNREPTILEESEDVLEILFQFIQPPSNVFNFRYPSVIDINPPATFFKLAEAAERYGVFTAMGACNTRMHIDVHTYHLEVLNYAHKHKYDDLIGPAAFQSLRDVDYEHVGNILTAPGLLVKWIKWYAQWRLIVYRGAEMFEENYNLSFCDKLFRLWSAYNLNCTLYPVNPGQFFLDLKTQGKPSYIANSLYCTSLWDQCLCRHMYRFEQTLSDAEDEMPHFQDL